MEVNGAVDNRTERVTAIQLMARTFDDERFLTAFLDAMDKGGSVVIERPNQRSVTMRWPSGDGSGPDAGGDSGASTSDS